MTNTLEIQKFTKEARRWLTNNRMGNVHHSINIRGVMSSGHVAILYGYDRSLMLMSKNEKGDIKHIVRNLRLSKMKGHLLSTN